MRYLPLLVLTVSVSACVTRDTSDTAQSGCEGGDTAELAPAEVCDGVDNDCDGEIDEAPTNGTAYFADTDADGFGDPTSTQTACEVPNGYVTDSTDCDDTNAQVNPDATELCNGIDDNCNTEVDTDATDFATYYADGDGDGDGDPNTSQTACGAPDGYVPNETDCDDTSAQVHPDATELCNSIDDDCDGTIDAGASDATTFYADADADGFGDVNAPTSACAAPEGYITDDTDCDDSDATAFPGQHETCDGVDNNCDGVVDEDFATTDFSVEPDAAIWQLNGTATWDPLTESLRLTEILNDQLGSIFYTQRVNASHWHAGFDFELSDGSKADGFALAILNTDDPTALGIQGGGLGCADLDALCVGFDTYAGPDHIEVRQGLDFYGFLAYADVTPLWNAGSRRADVFWDSGRLQVFVDGVGYVDIAVDPSVVPTGDQVTLGWTGSTGAQAQYEYLHSVSLGCGATAPDLDGDGSPLPDDCDDTDPAISPLVPDVGGDRVDANCDGVDGVDSDGDGQASMATGGTDCDDSDATVFAGMGCPVAGASCQAILAGDSTSPDGVYSIESDMGNAVQTWCDMTGGGWTLTMVKNSLHSEPIFSTASGFAFGDGNYNLDALARDPATTSSLSETSVYAGWLDMNTFPALELRVAAYKDGALAYMSTEISTYDLRIPFGQNGYFLYGAVGADNQAYYWCGGDAAYTDGGAGQVNTPIGAPADCKGHVSLGSGWDFSASDSPNQGLTVCGGESSDWMHNSWGGSSTTYGSAGSAQAIWMR